MKKNKFIRNTLAFAAAAVMLFSFTACGKNKAIGSYNLIGLGEEVGVEELKQAGVEMSLEIKEDNTYVLKMDENNSSDGKWEEDGDGIKLISDGDPLNGTLKDNVLTLENDDGKMVFEKK